MKDFNNKYPIEFMHRDTLFRITKRNKSTYDLYLGDRCLTAYDNCDVETFGYDYDAIEEFCQYINEHWEEYGIREALFDNTEADTYKILSKIAQENGLKLEMAEDETKVRDDSGYWILTGFKNTTEIWRLIDRYKHIMPLSSAIYYRNHPNNDVWINGGLGSDGLSGTYSIDIRHTNFFSSGQCAVYDTPNDFHNWMTEEQKKITDKDELQRFLNNAKQLDKIFSTIIEGETFGFMQGDFFGILPVSATNLIWSGREYTIGVR